MDDAVRSRAASRDVLRARVSPSRRAAVRALLGFGLVCLVAGALRSPELARALHLAGAVDRADVFRMFSLTSAVLGLCAFALAAWIRRGPGRVDKLVLLFTVLALGLLADRGLLTLRGLSLWQHDTELGYRQRPNAVRSLASYGRPDDLIRINSYGMHDTEFPRAKPAGELRILALGDSITQGDGVPYAETFSAVLERSLAHDDRAHRSFQVINAGVHGYSTFQERIVFERNLDLEPDVVLVGFCMNDVTEPFVVDTRFGGVGLDFHGVTQTGNALSGWVMNETGIGRQIQKLGERGKTREAEKRLESYNVYHMARASRTDPAMQEAWRIVLSELEAIYALAREKNIPVGLVVFPFTFQLASDAQREPQRILADHARGLGVPVLDLTDPLARAVYDDPEILAVLRRKGYDDEALLAFYRWRAQLYFLDEDHLTARGHELVGAELLAFLDRQGWLGPAR